MATIREASVGVIYNSSEMIGNVSLRRLLCYSTQTWLICNQYAVIWCYSEQPWDETSSYIALLQRRNTNSDSNLAPIGALFGLMSNPLWLKIRSNGAEVAGGGQNIFSNSGCINWYREFCAIFAHGCESWGCGVLTNPKQSIKTAFSFFHVTFFHEFKNEINVKLYVYLTATD